MITQEQADMTLAEIDAAVRDARGREEAIRAAMTCIARRLPHYDWVGVYVLQDGMLNLGPYVGAHTEHTLIPVGTGVCGTAITQERNQIVADVRERDNYLACSVETRAEIVVLIRDPDTGQILGQIDADSDTVGAFDETDEAFLTQVADRLVRHWELEAQ